MGLDSDMDVGEMDELESVSQFCKYLATNEHEFIGIKQYKMHDTGCKVNHESCILYPIYFHSHLLVSIRG